MCTHPIFGPQGRWGRENLMMNSPPAFDAMWILKQTTVALKIASGEVQDINREEGKAIVTNVISLLN